MAEAQTGDTVKIHYTGRLEDGTVFDSSEGRDPLGFTLGSGQVIPGFEQAVLERVMNLLGYQRLERPVDERLWESRACSHLVNQVVQKAIPQNEQISHIGVHNTL